MQHRSERLLIETARHRITGSVTLPRGGYRSRISDYLNSGERDFIALTDVVMESLETPGRRVTHDFLAISRRHIVLAVPIDGTEVEAG